jgi:hypothetical protein
MPMTEQEWLSCTDPTPMLEYLREKTSERKLRLFGCACVRRVWDRLIDKQSRGLVEVGEQYADGLVSEEQLSGVRHAYNDHQNEGVDGDDILVYYDTIAADAASEVVECGAAIFCALFASQHAASAGYYEGDEVAERAAQAVLLRDLIGNLFRPVAINPAWLAWNDGMVHKAAQAIYDERAFYRMPILADALQEAGCDSADILEHCRSDGPHVRGCWALDLLLSKE